jgi:hypothetical protein
MLYTIKIITKKINKESYIPRSMFDKPNSEEGKSMISKSTHLAQA